MKSSPWAAGCLQPPLQFLRPWCQVPLCIVYCLCHNWGFFWAQCRQCLHLVYHSKAISFYLALLAFWIDAIMNWECPPLYALAYMTAVYGLLAHGWKVAVFLDLRLAWARPGRVASGRIISV